MGKFTNIVDGILNSNLIVKGKVDVGSAGVPGGLDVGEGGSFTTGLVAYLYDASAISGSRFTQITLDGTNIFPNAVGDRVFFGCPNIFWAIRVEISIVKSSEEYECGYWDGELEHCNCMGILKDTVKPLQHHLMVQNAEKEYFTWDKEVESDWVVIDNVLDKIPNTGAPLYWIYLEVPSGGITTSPTITEIKARGSDFDIITGTSFSVFWGGSRAEIHERLGFVSAKKKGGADKVDIDLTATQKQTVLRFKAVNEYATFIWSLPAGIDTSCAMEFTLDYYSKTINAADIKLDIRKLQDDTPIGTGETSDLINTITINPVAANTYYDEISLTGGGHNRLSIENLHPGNLVGIQITRTDTNGGDFHPLSLTIHYIKWAIGEH